MSAKGPVILVEDDEDDENLFRETLHDLGIENKFIHFNNCIDAYSYLKNATENPLIIISDINLPKKNGIEFKKQIDKDPELRSKSIPFIFLTTPTHQKWIDTAYKEMTVQGFFHKTSKVQEFKRIMKII